MGQYNLRFEQEEFTELVRLYSELAKIADRQMNEYQMILDIINTNAVISGELHELALCDAMLKMVRDISREQALEGVRSITVRVGTLSGVVPRFLTDCWVAVTDGTEYDGVPLRVETEAGRARCLDCGAEFVADVEDLSCPDCGGKKLMPLSGRDMTIQEIEAY